MNLMEKYRTRLNDERQGRDDMTGQVKGEPETLPLEKPVQPSQVPLADPVKNDEMALGIGSETQGSLSFIPEEEKVLTIQEHQTPRQPHGRSRAKMAPVKIYSRLFNEEIYVVADQEEMEALVSKGVKEVVYVAWEIPALKGMDKERLRAVHLTKKVFPGAGLA